MAEIILYMGESSVGKSTAMEGLDHLTTYLITPNSKSLPFRGGNRRYVEGVNRNTTNLLNDVFTILRYVSEHLIHVKTVVVEDYFHFISNRIFEQEFLDATSGNEAFGKWNVLGADVYHSLFAYIATLRADLDIVVITHTEIKKNGMVGIKTAGNLMDHTIDVESHFSYVFHGRAIEDKGVVHYLIQTNRSGSYRAKTPRGCFSELYVPNNLRSILDTIAAYRDGEEPIPVAQVAPVAAQPVPVAPTPVAPTPEV